MARASSGSSAMFTYDFGIKIAQGTVRELAKLTGITASLAGAYYAVQQTVSKYTSTLRENTLRFGGVLSTMKAMEQAQARLIKGQSYFTMDDQLEGMNKLMQVGVKVGNNLDWINKAAHATGKSYSQFAGAISSAIQGNTNQLVEMGLLTQRATRMFDKYGANTIQRQQAILNFVKQHKGLQAAIANDFETIQDQITRLKGIWQGFIMSVVGKPNDPSSLYGQVVQTLKGITDAIARNYESIKKVGQGIGMVLGWVVKQAGKFVTWIGKHTKKILSHIWGSADSFVEWCRSLVVWLEFWKLKIIDFFKTYKKQILIMAATVGTIYLIKKAMNFGGDSILSLWEYGKAFKKLIKFMKMESFGFFGGLGRLMEYSILKKSRNRNIMRALGLDPRKLLGKLSGIGFEISSWFHKLPKMLMRGLSFKNLGKGFISIFTMPIKLIGKLGLKMRSVFTMGLKFGKTLVNLVLNLPRLIGAALNALRAAWTALNSTNPVGWVILAITAVVVLYKKCAGFRKLINGIGRIIINWYKLIWNTLMTAYAAVRVGLQKLGQWFVGVWNDIKHVFSWLGECIGKLWGMIMNSKFGQWINTYIVEPLSGVFTWCADLWNNLWAGLLKGVKWICEKLGMATDWMGNAAQNLAKEGGFKVKTFDATQYKEDDTDYLNFGNLKSAFGGGKGQTNPLNAGLSTAPVESGGGGSGVNNTMNFSNGAIQIVIEKGEHLDENKLARKIREVILDTNRDMAVRGGYA